MPRPLIYTLLVVVALSLIPVGMLYKNMATRSRTETRIQVVYDMDDQPYHKAQSENPFFADGMSMRKPPAGTVAHGQLQVDDGYFAGTAGSDTTFVAAIPMPVTEALLDRGQDRFNVFCAPCHGLSGNGNGPVHVRAMSLAEGTWTPPTDLGSQSVIDRPAGHLYNTIAKGIRNMPSYGSQISPADRWAVVAYVRAIQLTRNAELSDVPVDARAALGN
jgi:mono/diheme cytochrome c family protein